MSPAESIAELRHDALVSLAIAASVKDVAATLAQVGVEVMPVKGALLLQTLYANEGRRSLSDIDLLVLPSNFDRACQQLARVGHRFVSTDREGRERVFDGRTAAPLDMQQALFQRSLFSLSVEDLFRRGSRDTQTFGIAVRTPSALDQYAIALGGWVKSMRFDAPPRDLGELRSYYDLPPRLIAEHLRRCGMARAAYYALPFANSEIRVLEALGPCDKDTELAIRLATGLVRMSGGPRIAGMHLLNATNIQGFESFCFHVAHGTIARMRQGVAG